MLVQFVRDASITAKLVNLQLAVTFVCQITTLTVKSAQFALMLCWVASNADLRWFATVAMV